MCFTNLLVAQNNITNSPYSLYGVGDPLSTNNTMGFAMGDVKYSLTRPFYLNYANPASYSWLSAPTFSVAAYLNRTKSSTELNTQYNDNGSLAYFGLGIPLNKRMGMAIGARPFTSIGYGITIDSELDYPGDLRTRYEGEGGLNIAYFGLSYSIIRDTAQTLAIGINNNLYFGNRQVSSINQLDANTGAMSSMFTSSGFTSDFAFDLGLMYSVNLNKLFQTEGHVEHTINLGGTYALPNHLRTRFEEFSGSYTTFSGNNIIVRDTLHYSKDTSSIYLPNKIGLGATYQLYNRHSKNLIILSADYEQMEWNKLTVNNVNQNLEASNQYSFGMQFVPNATAIRGLFSYCRYRVGARFKETRLLINNERLLDYSASAGIGIPLVRSKSAYSGSSTVDFGFEVGSRGTRNGGLIREEYTNIYIGLSLSPNYWDRWFQKRKIN